MMHKLHHIPQPSERDPFSMSLMLCDPVGGMGTDHIERVDCPDCIRLIRADRRRSSWLRLEKQRWWLERVAGRPLSRAELGGLCANLMESTPTRDEVRAGLRVP
jgi:hypothetical protein